MRQNAALCGNGLSPLSMEHGSHSRGFHDRYTVIMFVLLYSLPQSQLLTTQIKIKKTFENIVGKGENAGNQHFLLFSHCFQPYLRQKSSF